MRNVAIGALPEHIIEIACWSSNELQVEKEGKISYSDSDRKEHETNVFFLPHLVDTQGRPLTVEYLRDYTIQGWEKPTHPEAISRDLKRIWALARQHQAAKSK